MRKWYILHTLSGAEEKAKANLDARIKAFGMADSIEKVIIPKEQVTEVRMGKKRILERKYFPGYILVFMDLSLLFTQSLHVQVGGCLPLT